MTLCSVDISAWKFPLSLILSLTFLAGVFLLWKYLPERRLKKFLSGRIPCIVSLASITICTMIEGTWGIKLHSSPFFWAFVIIMMISLEFTILNSFAAREYGPRLIMHSGMFLLVFGSFWGAPDLVKAQMAVGREKGGSIALSMEGKSISLPFSITLKEFRIDRYEDSPNPKQYVSILETEGKEYSTSVNHPCRIKGYSIYQTDFDHENGIYSVLTIVRDPWIPLVYLGMILLAAGAFLLLRVDWKSRYLSAALIVAALVFTALSIARINFSNLMPVLRSWWFVPHLAMYMTAYSTLALSLVLYIAGIFGKRKDSLHRMSGKLFSTSSSLLLAGMICGAVWAKSAWGDWWTWDAKECWAAATWMLTTVGAHLPSEWGKKSTSLLISIILSFAAMQITWYGVEKLPASQTSLHSYK